jgi:hypothetical protein
MNTQLIDKTNDNLIRLANMLGYKTYRYSDPLVEKIKNLDINSQMRIMFRINNLF